MKNKKWMNTLLGGALATLGYAQNLQAAPAEYFRVWEGHKRAELSDAVFKQMLGGFMDDTRALYEGRGLSEAAVREFADVSILAHELSTRSIAIGAADRVR